MISRAEHERRLMERWEEDAGYDAEIILLEELGRPATDEEIAERVEEMRSDLLAAVAEADAENAAESAARARADAADVWISTL